MVKRISKQENIVLQKYIFLISILILCIYILAFFILFYPFHDLSNQEIISFFNTLFVISTAFVISSYHVKPLITLFGSVILSVIILFLTTTIVTITNDFIYFLLFIMFLVIFIVWILFVIYNFKKGNIQLK